MGILLGLFKTVIGQWQIALLALAIGLTAGAWGALYTKSKFDKAAQVDIVVDQRKDDLNAISDSQRKETTLTTRLEKTRTNATENKTKLGHTVVVKQASFKCPEIPNVEKLSTVVESQVDNTNVFLTNGDVRVLNNVRANTPDSAAPISDAESQAASPVTVKALVASDAVIAEQYNDLAVKHDTLVDFVSDLIKKLNDKILSGK